MKQLFLLFLALIACFSSTAQLVEENTSEALLQRARMLYGKSQLNKNLHTRHTAQEAYQQAIEAGNDEARIDLALLLLNHGSDDQLDYVLSLLSFEWKCQSLEERALDLQSQALTRKTKIPTSSLSSTIHQTQCAERLLQHMSPLQDGDVIALRPIMITRLTYFSSDD